LTHPTDSPSGELEWQDGQPFSRRFGDVFFSRDSGIAETQHVFLAGNALHERWASLAAGAQIVVAETGFGTGLNFLCAWALWDETAPRDARLHYVTIEAHLPRATSSFARSRYGLARAPPRRARGTLGGVRPGLAPARLRVGRRSSRCWWVIAAVLPRLDAVATPGSRRLRARAEAGQVVARGARASGTPLPLRDDLRDFHRGKPSPSPSGGRRLCRPQGERFRTQA
jgi:hypothetical protein